MGTESNEERENRLTKLDTTMHRLHSAILAGFARSQVARQSLREDLKAEGESLFMLIGIFLGAAASLAMVQMLSFKGPLELSAPNIMLIAAMIALAMLHRSYKQIKSTNAPRLVLFSMVFEKGLLWAFTFFPDFSKAISYVKFLASFVKQNGTESQKDKGNSDDGRGIEIGVKEPLV